MNLRKLCEDAIADDNDGWLTSPELVAWREAATPQAVLELIERIEVLEGALQAIYHRACDVSTLKDAADSVMDLQVIAREALKGDKP